jgi:hypothetical protein
VKRLRISGLGALIRQKRFELGDGHQGARWLIASREQVLCTDVSLGNPALQISETGVHELTTRLSSHKPALGYGCSYVRKDSKLEAAVRALDGRASLRNEGIIELVFRAAAATTYIHRVFVNGSL